MTEELVVKVARAIVPRIWTCLTYDGLPSTDQEIAHCAARAAIRAVEAFKHSVEGEAA